MPFQSEAQRRKFGELVKQGKISQAEFDKWNKETGKTKLPERKSPMAQKPAPKPPPKKDLSKPGTKAKDLGELKDYADKVNGKK